MGAISTSAQNKQAFPFSVTFAGPEYGMPVRRQPCAEKCTLEITCLCVLLRKIKAVILSNALKYGSLIGWVWLLFDWCLGNDGH